VFESNQLRICKENCPANSRCFSSVYHSMWCWWCLSNTHTFVQMNIEPPLSVRTTSAEPKKQFGPIREKVTEFWHIPLVGFSSNNQFILASLEGRRTHIDFSSCFCIKRTDNKFSIFIISWSFSRRGCTLFEDSAKLRNT
jgi:hypothetical protein